MVEAKGSDGKAGREGPQQSMGYSPRTSISSRPGLMGPVLLIALGIVFLISEFVPDWGLGKTWPILLIVIGVLKLLDSGRPPRPPEGPRL